MRIKVDTDSKVIHLEQSAKLTELFSLVKKLFPNDEWKQYSLEAVTVINNWNNPIYVPWEPQQPILPWTVSSGTFCVETN